MLNLNENVAHMWRGGTPPVNSNVPWGTSGRQCHEREGHFADMNLPPRRNQGNSGHFPRDSHNSANNPSAVGNGSSSNMETLNRKPGVPGLMGEKMIESVLAGGSQSVHGSGVAAKKLNDLEKAMHGLNVVRKSCLNVLLI